MKASNKSDYYTFRDQFRQLMEKDQIYLDPTISLIELADRLGTNRTYVSQYINNEMQCSYYDYVNSLRIKWAAHLLESGDDKIEFIAHHSGYTSITTFRRIFKKFFGVTAGEYRKRLKNK